ELIPSGETSSYRSNPLKLAEFALSRKEPKYVGRAKEIFSAEKARRDGEALSEEFANAIATAGKKMQGSVSVGSGIYAVKPGDGSAREQAASCQRVLGGVCNIATEYATKRYRSNLINWGMLPFLSTDKFELGDIVIVYDVKNTVLCGGQSFVAKVVRDGKSIDIDLRIDSLTNDEKDIVATGCLMNYYKSLLK
ncbi:MAG: hydratase, partial [Clostridia bacterium]